MDNLHPGGRHHRRSRRLSPLCRRRRSIPSSLSSNAVQQPLWLLVVLQLTTILLILASPVPVPVALRPVAVPPVVMPPVAVPPVGEPAGAIPWRRSVPIPTVISPIQP